MLRLGAVLGDWLVVNFQQDSARGVRRAVVARIPDGETVLGLGRTWHSEQVECRLITCAKHVDPGRTGFCVLCGFPAPPKLEV